MICVRRERIRKRRWTDDEIEFLKQNYEKMDTRAIAVVLNRSLSAIHHKAHRLGLRKPEEMRYYNVGATLFKILQQKIQESGGLIK